MNESECGVQITNWHNTPQGNVQALVEAIYNNGPISVAIDASHLSFAFYSHGVYFEPKCGGCTIAFLCFKSLPLCLHVWGSLSYFSCLHLT